MVCLKAASVLSCATIEQQRPHTDCKASHLASDGCGPPREHQVKKTLGYLAMQTACCCWVRVHTVRTRPRRWASVHTMRAKPQPWAGSYKIRAVL
eukprot:366441-Chlamydomonas_euryale.AAC.31